VTLADLVFYFDVCNTAYFGINAANYPHIWQWFQRLYANRELKIITHQWFAMAKQISRLFRPSKQKAKL
jgi:glutathione S-transferase